MVCDKGKEINPSGRDFAEIGVNGDDEKADGPDYGGYCGLFASFEALLRKRVHQNRSKAVSTVLPEIAVVELVRSTRPPFPPL